MKNKLFFLAACITVFALLFTACNGGDKFEPVPVTGLSLNKETMKFAITGLWEKLDAVVLPKNATDKDLEWSSDNPSVAPLFY
jgi:hypothetical protein